MGVWTNNGLTLIATAVQTAGANVAPAYVGMSPGCGTLQSAVTSGTPLTALPLDAALPTNLGSGQSLTVTDGVHSETVTTSGVVTAGATSIPINSWTPVNSYATHSTGVAPTPQATDTTLYNETVRVALSAAAAGASPGESLLSAYFDGSQPTAFYLLAGWFGGAAATSSTGTGTLMAEDILSPVWNHVINADTYMAQGDGTI